MRWDGIAGRLCGLAALLGAWEAASRQGHGIAVASPGETLAALAGLLAGWYPAARAFLIPSRWMLTSVPGVVTVMLGMLWFGLGSAMVVAIGGAHGRADHPRGCHRGPGHRGCDAFGDGPSLPFHPGYAALACLRPGHGRAAFLRWCGGLGHGHAGGGPGRGPGGILAVLGPSGIGKSTLLRLAARLSRPTSGTVMLAVRRIGFVFQEPRLLPWRTALENVALPLLAMGVPLEQARTRAAAMLGRMGLAAFATSCPETLSGGMRQRVSLARAFVVEPELLLLDEPFTGLDPELRLSMRRHLDALLAASGAASLHVTHDIGDIPVRTNRILRLTAAGVRFERPCDLGMTVLKEAL